jgi:putative addiction module CopG family antidote
MKLQNREFVDEKIAKGAFASEAQVVDEALRRWREEEQIAGLEELRQKVNAGIQDLESGRSAPLDMEAIKDRIRQECESA